MNKAQESALGRRKRLPHTKIQPLADPGGAGIQPAWDFFGRQLWKLGISEHTVKFHLAMNMSKLGAASRTEAVTTGIRRGLVLL